MAASSGGQDRLDLGHGRRKSVGADGWVVPAASSEASLAGSPEAERRDAIRLVMGVTLAVVESADSTTLTSDWTSPALTRCARPPARRAPRRPPRDQPGRCHRPPPGALVPTTLPVLSIT